MERKTTWQSRLNRFERPTRFAALVSLLTLAVSGAATVAQDQPRTTPAHTPDAAAKRRIRVIKQWEAPPLRARLLPDEEIVLVERLFPPYVFEVDGTLRDLLLDREKPAWLKAITGMTLADALKRIAKFAAEKSAMPRASVGTFEMAVELVAFRKERTHGAHEHCAGSHSRASIDEMATTRSRTFVLDTTCFVDASRTEAEASTFTEICAWAAPRLYLSTVVAAELRAGAGTAQDRRVLERQVLSPAICVAVV